MSDQTDQPSDESAKVAEEAFAPVIDRDGKLDEPEYPSENEREDQITLVRSLARERARLRPWQQRFFDELVRTGNLTKAAAAGNLNIRSCYRWKTADAAFAEAWEAALRLHVDDVEETVVGLAKAGDPRLAEFVLRARRREVYGEKLDVNIGGTIGVVALSGAEVEAALVNLSPLRSMLGELMARHGKTLPAPVIEVETLPAKTDYRSE